MKIRSWKPKRKGALIGFTEVEVGEFVISDVAILDGKNGLFASFPRRTWKAGHPGVPVLEFIDRERAKAFSEALVSALQRAYPEDFNQNVRRLG